MFSSSSWFVHLQNKQKQTLASDDYHVATTAENLTRNQYASPPESNAMPRAEVIVTKPCVVEVFVTQEAKNVPKIFLTLS